MGNADEVGTQAWGPKYSQGCGGGGNALPDAASVPVASAAACGICTASSHTRPGLPSNITLGPPHSYAPARPQTAGDTATP